MRATAQLNRLKRKKIWRNYQMSIVGNFLHIVIPFHIEINLMDNFKITESEFDITFSNNKLSVTIWKNKIELHVRFY